MHGVDMRLQPHRVIELFELIILRPLSVVFIALAVVALLKAAWIVGIAMTACWFLVGAIGGTLPHRKRETFSELTQGITLEPHDGPLPDRDGFALGRAVLTTAAVVGLAASVLAWRSGLRWYWVLACGIAGYFVTGIAGGFIPPALARRKARSAGP